MVRSYEHSIFAKPFRKTEDDGKVPAANMAFTKATRGRNKMKNFVAFARNKPSHLAKVCWQGSKGSAGKKESKDHAKRPGNSGSGGKITGLVSCVERSVTLQRIAIIELIIIPPKKMKTPRKGSLMVVIVVVVSSSGILRVQKPIRIIIQKMRIAMSGTCLLRSRTTLTKIIRRIIYLLYTTTHLL